MVIVGTFLIDSKKDVNTGVKVKASAVLPPGCHHQVKNVGFRSAVGCSSVRNMVWGNDVQQQAIRGSHFMIQALHGFTDWRGGPDARSTVAGAYELTGMIYLEGLKRVFVLQEVVVVQPNNIKWGTIIKFEMRDCF